MLAALIHSLFVSITGPGIFSKFWTVCLKSIFRYLLDRPGRDQSYELFCSYR